VVVSEAAHPATTAPAIESKPAAENGKAKAPEAKPATHRYGPVKAGETLRGIAGKVRHENVTLEQMMVGLYQANRNAFVANNMNRLKRGKMLKVPGEEAIQLEVSPSQAAHTVQGQASEWHAYRRKVAEMAEEVPTVKTPEPAAGKLEKKTEQKAPPAAAAPRDVLHLSKGEPGGAGRPDAKIQEKLHTLEEEVAAKGRALQEAQDRVGQLERTVHDMEKLLKLKTQEVAKAPVQPPPAPVAVKPPVVAPAPVPTVPPVVAMPPTPASVAPPPPPEIKTKPAPAPMLAARAGAAIGYQLARHLHRQSPLYRRHRRRHAVVRAVVDDDVGTRRKQGLNKFEDSIMTGGEFKNNAVFNATTPASTAAAGMPTEGSMLLTDFSRLGLGAIDTHEVDPIAEAEVYMAYGRDAQAEEILKEALIKDPSRHEIALKLLEIYAARKDTVAFETVASELYAGMGGQGTPVWQRAAEMGRSIDPAIRCTVPAALIRHLSSRLGLALCPGRL